MRRLRPPKRRSPRLVNAGRVRRASRLAEIVPRTMSGEDLDGHLRATKRRLLEALAVDIGAGHPDFQSVSAMAEGLA